VEQEGLMVEANQVVNPPPTLNYLVPAAIVATVLMTAILLAVSTRMDRTKGTLTISLLIVVSFVGVTSYCLIFTIPTDEVTPAVVGGLTAGFGAVVAYWLGRTQPAPPPNEAPPHEPLPPRDVKE
jgi:FtsH-binding integral membrane protein